MFKTAIRRAFSTCVDFKLFYPEGHAKVFKLGINASATEVKDLIQKEEEGRFTNIELLMGQKDYMKQEIPFVDFVVHNPVQFVIDGNNFAFQLDSRGPVNYIFNNQGFEERFNELEIPYQDSFIVSKYFQTFTDTMDQQKQIYSNHELKRMVDQAVLKFADKNSLKTTFWTTYQEVAQRIQQEVAYKEHEVERVQEESKREAYGLLKKWIVISLTQYFFLLLLTYGLCSWNVSEPISYLLAQTLETIGIFYFLRRGFAFRQSNLFARRYTEVFQKRVNLKNNSTNYLAETSFARDKLNMVQSKIIYGTTTN